MSSTQLYRLSGGALLFGSLLVAITTIIRGALGNPLGALGNPLHPLWVPISLLYFIGSVLVLLSFPGLYARQAQETGVLGLSGFILFFIAGLMLGVGYSVLTTLILPWLATHGFTLSNGPSLGLYFLLGALSLTVGGILFGLATIRAGIFSRWAGLLLIISVVVDLVGRFLPIPFFGTASGVIVFAALTWLGYALWTNPGYDSKDSRFF